MNSCQAFKTLIHFNELANNEDFEDVDDLQPLLLNLVENGIYKYPARLIQIIKDCETVDQIIEELEYKTKHTYKLCLAFRRLLYTFVPETSHQESLMTEAITDIERVILQEKYNSLDNE